MNENKSPFGDDFRYLIEERIKNFWGYGNLKSDIWFIGMEEGYNQNSEVLLERFEATSGKEIFDIYDDLKVDPGHNFWFEKNAPTQSTYRKLIYILLYLQNKIEPTLEEIRQFQINKFGRKNSNHAVLELMPLPAKSTKEKDWLYAETEISGLQNRKEYLAKHKQSRVERLKELMGEYKPKIVIFYSRIYLSDWQKTADTILKEVLPKKLHIAKDHDTIYAVIPHSTAFGLSANDWREIAESIAKYL